MSYAHDTAEALPGWPTEPPAVMPLGWPGADAPPPPPPGISYGLGADGRLVPVYQQAPAPAPLPAVPAAKDPWPARLLAGGAAASGTVATVGVFAPQLASLQGPAVAVAVAAGALYLLKSSSGSKQAPVNVSVNVTGPTIHASSRSRSR